MLCHPYPGSGRTRKLRAQLLSSGVPVGPDGTGPHGSGPERREILRATVAEEIATRDDSSWPVIATRSHTMRDAK